jgi:hypothetical protein
VTLEDFLSFKKMFTYGTHNPPASASRGVELQAFITIPVFLAFLSLQCFSKVEGEYLKLSHFLKALSPLGQLKS